MKIFCKNFVPTLVFLFVLASVNLAHAKEAKLEIENTTAFTVDIALVYMKDKRSAPVSRGWYVVNPRSKATIAINTDSEKIFWYAKTDDGWYWGGDENNKNDATFDIYQAKFSVEVGKKLQGKTAVPVRFKGIPRQKDTFHLRLVD